MTRDLSGERRTLWLSVLWACLLVLTTYAVCGCDEVIDSVQIITDDHCQVKRVTLIQGKLVNGALDAVRLDAVYDPQRVEIVTRDGRRVVYQGRTLPQAEVLSGGESP